MIKFYLTVCLLLNHLTNETSLVIKDYKMLTIFLSIFNFKEMSYSELKKISSQFMGVTLSNFTALGNNSECDGACQKIR